MRSCSIRSSIALNALETSATSPTARVELDPPARLVRVDPAHQRREALQRLEGAPHQHTLTPSSTSPEREHDDLGACRRGLTVTGDTASTTAAATIAPALIETTRPNKDTGKG